LPGTWPGAWIGGKVVDKRYESFCLVDPLFYDLPTSAGADLDFPIASRALPPGWRRTRHEDWVILDPPKGDLPPQGWKIHVSATLENAERVLDTVWGYCVARQLPFKFLSGRHVLQLRNAKYAHRGSSGKLVTIYPADEATLETVCTELGEALAGEPGPYILSDLRWGPGPLYVRYGGFARRYCVSDRGELVPAIARPDGTLVPDRRGPVFSLPDWVTLPDFLAPHLAARQATTVNDLPYEIRQVLHFSNGGGLYRGVDRRTGQTVILKEARPHAGLDATGADAVARLERERMILERLAGLDVVPALIDYVVVGEHHFLVEQFVEGSPLNKLFADRYPLSDPSAGPERYAQYRRWAMGIYERVEAAVHALHQRGVVFGDLHLYNILVGPDDRITLIDFEVASLIDEQRRPGIGNPGFSAPADRTGFDIDRYALACLRLALFLPMTALIKLAPGKAAHFAQIIQEQFDVPDDFLRPAVHTIDQADAPDASALPPSVVEFAPAPNTWECSRDQIARSILASATPDRSDRLFPGDIEQFTSGGLSFGYGAAGVLYALAVTGAGRYPAYEQWLLERVQRPGPGARLGFYDGLHGIGYALAELGYRQQALDLIEMVHSERWEDLSLDLASGLAGVGLNLAHLAQLTGESHLRDLALRVAEVVASRLGGVTDVPTVSGGRHPYAGLMRGSSGPALLFIRLYELTGQTALLDYAATALRQDLRRCVRRPDGSLHVNEGWRTLPYLDRGSAGIGMVLDHYLLHREDEEFAQASGDILPAALSPFYIQPGLFAGRAGLIVYLAHRYGPAAASQPDTLRQMRRLNWHAIAHADGIAFPGEQLLRLSTDLATGSAGILLALGAVLNDQPIGLPFLHSPRSHQRSVGSMPASPLAGAR